MKTNSVFVPQLFIVLIFFMSACSFSEKHDGLELFSAHVYTQLLTANKIEVLNEKYINSGEEIIRPVNTWQEILRVHTLGGEQNRDGKISMFYKIPYITTEKKIPGIISFRSKGKEIVSLPNVYSLKIFQLENDEFIANAKKKLEGFVLYLEINYKENAKKDNLKHEWLAFPILNLQKQGENGYLRKKFEGSVALKKYPGVTFFSNISREEIGIFDKEAIIPVGEREDSYPEKTAKRCNLKEANDSCENCRFGWFDAIGAIGRIAFCGQNRCGEKGWPACPRRSIQSDKIDCADGSDLVFCQEDLAVYCDENKVLICL